MIYKVMEVGNGFGQSTGSGKSLLSTAISIRPLMPFVMFELITAPVMGEPPSHVSMATQRRNGGGFLVVHGTKGELHEAHHENGWRLITLHKDTLVENMAKMNRSRFPIAVHLIIMLCSRYKTTYLFSLTSQLL